MLRFFIYLLVCSGGLLRPAPILADARQSTSLPEQIWVVTDNKLSMTPDEVRALPENAGEFHALDHLSFGFFNSAIWCRFTLSNNTETAVSKVLFIENSDIFSLELFSYHDDALIATQVAGKSHSLLKRTMNHRTPVFEIVIPPHTKHQYILRVHKLGGAVVLPLELLDPNEFEQQTFRSSGWKFLLLGLQLFAILFNLFLMAMLKRLRYLKYTFYVIFSILSLDGLTGLIGHHLWPDSVWLLERQTALFNFPGIFFLLLLIQDYFDVDTILPRLNRVFIGTFAVLIAGTILAMMSTPLLAIAISLSNFTTLFSFILTMTTCALSFKQKRRDAVFVWVSYTPMFFGVIVYFLRSIGAFTIMNTAVGLEEALTFHILTLTAALVDRFHRDEKEKSAIIAHANQRLTQLTIATRETNNAIAIYSAEGRIQWCNKAFERFFDWEMPKTDYPDAHIEELSMNKEISLYLKKCRDTGKSVSFETNIWGNETERWIQTTLTPILDQQNIRNFITIDTDLTDLKKKEREKEKILEQLLHAQKMETIGTLAGGIAHDFNNILTPIIGYIEIMTEDFPKNHPIHKKLAVVHTAAMRATELVKRILTFSRRFKENLDVIKFKDVVRSVQGLLKSTLPANINFTFVDCTKNDIIFADQVQMEQVVMNLCMNASHAIEEAQGELTLRLENIRIDDSFRPAHIAKLPHGEYLLLKVSDTGCGMDEETLLKLFDPFFTTKDVGKGTGLGLSVVHGIIEKYKGEIVYESKVGEGTTAFVYLPLYAGDGGSDNEEKLETPLPAKGHGETIIVIDDEKNILEMLGQILTANGYVPLCFSDSTKALEAFLEAPDDIDLVITDQTMPGLSGTEISKKMRSAKNNAKIMIITGYSDKLTPEIASDIGSAQLLFKPINTRTFLTAVEAVLKNSVD